MENANKGPFDYDTLVQIHQSNPTFVFDSPRFNTRNMTVNVRGHVRSEKFLKDFLELSDRIRQFKAEHFDMYKDELEQNRHRL